MSEKTELELAEAAYNTVKAHLEACVKEETAADAEVKAAGARQSKARKARIQAMRDAATAERGLKIVRKRAERAQP